MTDLHHNVFFYYRGPHTDSRAYEAQLENNTTKALINTLKHAQPPVRGEFLSCLGCPYDQEAELFLQSAPVPVDVLREKKHRLLLAIVREKSRWRPDLSGEATARRTRPDAWIVGKDLAVVIESKTKPGTIDETDKQEIQRHFDNLGPRDGRDYKELTWTEIHEFFGGLHTEDHLDAWLVEQFVQYLEYMNMCDFTGLKEEFFDYFFTHDRQDSRTWVKKTMEKFADKLLPELSKVDSFYEAPDVGRLQLSHTECWAAFGPRGKRERPRAHQTVSADSQGLHIFVNVELKPAIDRLRKKISVAQSTWSKILADLHQRTPFYIRIEERKIMGPRRFEYSRICEVESRYLDDGLAYVESTLRTVKLPCLSVRTRIDREEAIKMSVSSGGSVLIEKVAGIMAAFHPLVKFINAP